MMNSSIMRVKTHSITHDKSVSSADSTSGDPQADKTWCTECSLMQVLSSQRNETCSPTFFEKRTFFVPESLGVPFRLPYKTKKQPTKNQHLPRSTNGVRKICSQVSPLDVFFLPDSYCTIFIRSVFLVLSVLLPAHATPTDWKSDTINDQDSGAALANGIIFSHVTIVLLAEMFINVDFLVFVPKFDMNVSANLGAYIAKLEQLWSHPRKLCHLDYSSNFQKNDSTFDID